MQVTFFDVVNNLLWHDSLSLGHAACHVNLVYCHVTKYNSHKLKVLIIVSKHEKTEDKEWVIDRWSHGDYDSRTRN